MFHFFQHLAAKALGVVASAIIAIGIVNVPQPLPPIVAQHHSVAPTTNFFVTTTTPTSTLPTVIIKQNNKAPTSKSVATSPSPVQTPTPQPNNPTNNSPTIYPILSIGAISNLPTDQQSQAINIYNQFLQTPNLQYLPPDQQSAILKGLIDTALQTYQNQLQQQTLAAQNKLNQINTLKASYNQKINDLNQQILNIKQKYYQDVENTQQALIAGGATQSQQDMANAKLADDANWQIQQLQTQEQQAWVDYQNQLNALN